MELDIFIDKKKKSIRQDFTEDFNVLCPFCYNISKYIINDYSDLYCSKCGSMIASIVDRTLIKSNEAKNEPGEDEKHEFLEELTNNLDMKLLMFLKTRKNKIDNAFLNLLDKEILEAQKEENVEKLDTLLHLSKTLHELNLADMEEDKEKPLEELKDNKEVPEKEDLPAEPLVVTPRVKTELPVDFIYCDKCNAPNDKNDNFCGVCGNTIKKKEKLDYVKKIKDTIKFLAKSRIPLLSLFTDTIWLDENNFKRLINILSYDPTIVNTIIQSAGSIRGYSQPNITVGVAMNALGIKKSSEIVSQLFNTPNLKDIKKREIYRQICYHSFGVAIFSKLLALKFELIPDEMFMIGLMHDVGKLILYLAMPDEYEDAINRTRERLITISDAEREYLGMEHCEVGKIALIVWKYPDQFINTVTYHHNMEAVQNSFLSKQLLCIQAANILCNLSKIGNMQNIRTLRFEVFDKQTKEMTKGLNIPEMMTYAKQEIVNLRAIFGI